MPESLLTHIAAQVSSATRELGRQYYERGAVHALQGSAAAVSACVEGKSHRSILIARRGDALVVSCECSWLWERREACKHLWAALLEADARGHLRGGTGAPRELRIQQSEEVVPAARRGTVRGAAPPPTTWRDHVSRVAVQARKQPSAWPAGREICYAIDVPGSQAGEGLAIALSTCERRADGSPRAPRPLRPRDINLGRVPDAPDRVVLALMLGSLRRELWSYGYGNVVHLGDHILDTLLPMVCATGRLTLQVRDGDTSLRPLALDEGGPWTLRLDLTRADGSDDYRLSGAFERASDRLPLPGIALVLPCGYFITMERVARFEPAGAGAWAELLRDEGSIAVPAGEAADLVEALLGVPRLPPLAIPEEFRYTDARPAPQPALHIRPSRLRRGRLECLLAFDYEHLRVADGIEDASLRDRERRLVLWRDPEAEARYRARLAELGCRFLKSARKDERPIQLLPRHLARVVLALSAEGWQVEAEGKLYRQPGAFRLEVKSGIDWFELHGDVDFGGHAVSLPVLLQAIRRGEGSVLLDDGTLGMLPKAWLRKYALVAAAGTSAADHVRFGRAQAGLLDALLAVQAEARVDERFAAVRAELGRFEGLAEARPDAAFRGTLRPYQAAGLGWLLFLERTGLGGCLADDMGLGKTVQVLALLAGRRKRALEAGATPGPALIVAPRSLVFHWRNESRRFAPRLKVLDHTGQDRDLSAEKLRAHDLVLTTYGTLRRDVVALREMRFDYCVLDEAQAVKNAATETAKAVRLLHADHRLALSGTPIENHLGELWSLFEYLNPGMLGQAAVFQRVAVPGGALDDDSRSLLRRALKPFILRRTKESVAKDLPEKLEETLFCELEGDERKRYDELRDFYRKALLGQVDAEGMARAKFQVLEALLRLRQAACHPGLMDPRQRKAPSAKLVALMADLAEVTEEGHKTLVFSQFTKFLAIVRDRLDEAGIAYQYLDGQTRDREACVARFQEDADCRVFLISLKAGGLGLNLTAAEYVFFLDPWWNPAVEAQAINRAHRIGQTRRVFAYRLIARGTVEERVLELQGKKRDLADAILTEDAGVLRHLGREDLELLLS